MTAAERALALAAIIQPIIERHGSGFGTGATLAARDAAEAIVAAGWLPPLPTPLGDDCPACGAQAGMPCTVPTDRGRREVKWVHMGREDRFHERTGQ